MSIFLTIVMGPGLGFMLYALSQFWREARRFQRTGSRAHSGAVTAVTAISPADEENAFRAWNTPADRPSPTNESAVLNFAVAGDRRAQRKMFVTCLQNRVAVLRSEAGHPAVRRAAKG
jgi:hypothetical protein